MATERKPRTGEESEEEHRAGELAAFEEVVRRRDEVWAGKPILNDSAQIIREAREQRGDTSGVRVPSGRGGWR